MWRSETKKAQSAETLIGASCVRSLQGSDRLFAGINQTHAYPTSLNQPKPEVGE